MDSLQFTAGMPRRSSEGSHAVLCGHPHGNMRIVYRSMQYGKCLQSRNYLHSIEEGYWLLKTFSCGQASAEAFSQARSAILSRVAT